MKPFPLAPVRPLGWGGGGPEHFAALQDGFRKTTARFQSETDMPLRTASELKTIAQALDLTPVLDSIGDTCLAAAQAGLFEATVSVKDSVYEKFLDKISDALVAKGYATGFLGNGQIQISWLNAA